MTEVYIERKKLQTTELDKMIQLKDRSELLSLKSVHGSFLDIKYGILQSRPDTRKPLVEEAFDQSTTNAVKEQKSIFSQSRTKV